MRNYSSTTILLMAIPELKTIAPQHYEHILALAKQDRSALPWSRFSALALGCVALYFWFQFGAGRQLLEESIWSAILINLGIFSLLDSVLEYSMLRMDRDKVLAQLAKAPHYEAQCGCAFWQQNGL